MIKFPLKRKQDQLYTLKHYITDGKMAINKIFISNAGMIRDKGNLRSGHQFEMTQEQIDNMESGLLTMINQSTLSGKINYSLCYNIDDDLQAYSVKLSSGMIVLINRTYIDLIKDLSFTIYGKDQSSALIFKANGKVTLMIAMPVRYDIDKYNSALSAAKIDHPILEEATV